MVPRASGSVNMHVGHARVEFLIQELTRAFLMDNILLLKLKCVAPV